MAAIVHPAMQATNKMACFPVSSSFPEAVKIERMQTKAKMVYPKVFLIAVIINKKDSDLVKNFRK